MVARLQSSSAAFPVLDLANQSYIKRFQLVTKASMALACCCLCDRQATISTKFPQCTEATTDATRPKRAAVFVSRGRHCGAALRLSAQGSVRTRGWLQPPRRPQNLPHHLAGRLVHSGRPVAGARRGCSQSSNQLNRLIAVKTCCVCRCCVCRQQRQQHARTCDRAAVSCTGLPRHSAVGASRAKCPLAAHLP